MVAPRFISEAEYLREQEYVSQVRREYIEYAAYTDDELYAAEDKFFRIEQQYLAQQGEKERRNSSSSYQRNAMLLDLTYSVGKVWRLWGALHHEGILDQHYKGDREGTEKRYEQERDSAFDLLAKCCGICPLAEECPMKGPRRRDPRSLLNQLADKDIRQSFRGKVKRDQAADRVRSCMGLIFTKKRKKGSN